ncbi:MAG: site-specific integrase [Clostridia bacterium]|nr:site-specific integrase [Clostridia bacterium]
MNIQPRTLKDGSVVWRLEVVSHKDPATGRWVRVVRTVGPFPGAKDKGRARAEEAWRRLEAEVKRAARAGQDLAARTVAELVAAWIDKKRPEWRPKTVASYEAELRNHILPFIGDERVLELTPAKVDAWLQRLRRDGVGLRSANLARQLLRSAFEELVRLDALERNPVARVRPLKQGEKRPAMALSREELDALLHEVGPRVRALFEFAALTGLRRAELAGLRWTDVDWERQSLTVRRTRVDVSGKVIEQEGMAKTQAGLRRILLPEQALRVLGDLRELQIKEGAWSESGYVFAGPDGEPLQPHSITQAFERARDRAGLPEKLRFHDLRHSAVTIRLAAGIPPAVVAQQMGHKSLKTTLDTYSHLLPEDDAEAVRMLERYLKAQEKGETADGD